MINCFSDSSDLDYATYIFQCPFCDFVISQNPDILGVFRGNYLHHRFDEWICSYPWFILELRSPKEDCTGYMYPLLQPLRACVRGGVVAHPLGTSTFYEYTRNRRGCYFRGRGALP